MRKPIIFNLNGCYYLYSINNNQVLLINIILKSIIEYYLNHASINYTKIKNLEIFKKHNKSEVYYYYKKFLFLKRAGCLKTECIKIKKINPTIIKSNFINSHYISFALTDKCNLKCKYCTYSNLYNDSNSSRIKKDLDFTTIKKILDTTLIKQGLSNRTDEYGISFYGGEPLLKFDLIKKVVNYSKTRCPNLNLNYFMTTNGVLLDKYMNYIVENNFVLLIL